jgi:hypothetical protein
MKKEKNCKGDNQQVTITWSLCCIALLATPTHNSNPTQLTGRGLTEWHGSIISGARREQGFALSRVDESLLGLYTGQGVEGYGLDYPTLKRVVRDSLDHAFLPGASLWMASETFTMVTACAGDALGPEPASASCRNFLAASEKAQLEWKEEAEFARFESQF